MGIIVFAFGRMFLTKSLAPHSLIEYQVGKCFLEFSGVKYHTLCDEQGLSHFEQGNASVAGTLLKSF